MSIYADKLWIWCSNCADFGGNEPPFGKILAYDSPIRGVYVNGTGAHLAADGKTFVPGEDRFVTPALMTRTRSFGLLAGTWFVPRSSMPLVEASKAAAMVSALNPDCVLLDIETHDLGFQRAFVAEYRRLKPGRATDVTFEPRQDGTTVAAKDYLAARMDLFPQLYRSDMRPADAKHELMTWVPEAEFWGRVHLFVNAAQDWWEISDGAFFTAETLPDKRKALERVLGRVAPKRMHDRARPSQRWVDGEWCPPVVPCGEELGEEAA